MEELVQISLPAVLVNKLDEVANLQHTDLATVVSQAIERYLREQAHQEIEQEQQAYAAQHAQLLTKYAGEYIAMHHGQVIDHDENRAALSQRLRKRFGRTSVLITPVLAQPQQTITVRSPRLLEHTP
jgi:predicted transcriptional regulator